MAIQFFNTGVSVNLSQRTQLKRFMESMFIREQRLLGRIHYVFCSDAYLLEINIQFLQHDTLTDIITFPHSTKGEPVSGEIYISIDRVKENAQTYLKTYREELHRVIFHGALHLIGYNDKSRKEISQMKKKEDEYLSLYFKT